MLWSATAGSYAYALQQGLGLTFTGNFYFNNNGLQERWLQGTGGAWYYITPDGKFYAQGGTFLAIARSDLLGPAEPALQCPTNHGRRVAQPGQHHRPTRLAADAGHSADQ